MKITSRHIGNIMIEVTVSTQETSLTVDVCNLSGFVNLELIDNLKELAEELELHNEQLKLKRK